MGDEYTSLPTQTICMAMKLHNGYILMISYDLKVDVERSFICTWTSIIMFNRI